MESTKTRGPQQGAALVKRTTKYVALDVHQATTSASAREESGRVIARNVLPTGGAAITELPSLHHRLGAHDLFDRWLRKARAGIAERDRYRLATARRAIAISGRPPSALAIRFRNSRYFASAVAMSPLSSAARARPNRLRARLGESASVAAYAFAAAAGFPTRRARSPWSSR